MEHLSLSYINQFAYCPRRFWYIYVQGQMVENAHVLRGNINHANVDRTGYETTNDDIVRHRRVYVVSHQLGITGICDLVEEATDGTLTPIEYKQGKRGKWKNDEAQLCAQALCLEEMTGKSIEKGSIFYFGSRRRVEVCFDAQLRNQTQQLITQIHFALAEGSIPHHTDQRQRCKGCSLYDICLPKETELLKSIVQSR